MTFAEVLEQVRELLHNKGRVSYRALKLQFNLDDDYLEGLKDELIEAEHVAADEGSKVLVGSALRQFQVPSLRFQAPNPRLHQFRGEGQAAQERAETTIS